MIEKNKRGRPRETPSLRGRHFFLTVPHFEGSTASVVEALRLCQPGWEYLRYAAVLQTHTRDENKGAHLHLYVAFPKVTTVKLDRFDYLGKHGKLERVRSYSSVLRYMTKEGQPLANFDYIEPVMSRDFPRAVQLLLSQGRNIRDIYRDYSSIVASKNWAGYLRFLQFSVDSQKFRQELSKPGFRLITPDLVRARLSDDEYALYHSNPIYARIVDRINDIVRYGSRRPHKARALLLVGAPDTGKTTLGLALQSLVGTFTFPDDGWWQGYQSDVFGMIMWNQFDLRRFAYPTLLKFLQGLRMDLPMKGSHVTRCDNPFIFLTSNLTLEQHVRRRFTSQESRARSLANLGSRVDEIDIGSTPIFLLTRLLVPLTGDVRDSPLRDPLEGPEGDDQDPDQEAHQDLLG